MDVDAADNHISPWHPGEVTMQASIGVAERMDAIGRRVVRDYLIDQHRAFFTQLPFIVAGAVDKANDAWATLFAARPGFLQSPDPSTLTIETQRKPNDPADGGMENGDAIGLLGIELDTRRRNRLNGIVHRTSAARFAVSVEQSFGNCPRYIQSREFSFVRDPSEPHAGAVDTSTELDEPARAMIRTADTFFVASYADREDGHRQVDVSHRGGTPGFVRVTDDGRLTIPDFAGNLFFMTMGNILLNGKAGLVFVDFTNGDLLQMTGDAEVVLDSPEIAAFQNAERLWTFRPRMIVRRSAVLQNGG